MAEGRDRRAMPRMTLTEHPAMRVQGMREVRLLDLSLRGAQIEHLDLFRPSASCALDLPPPFEALSLPAQVVWCTVIGRQRKLGGTSHLLAHSGLRFTRLTGAQHAALTDTLQHLAATRQPEEPAPDPTETFETWLLQRVAHAVEAGEVSAALLTELQAEVGEARAMLPEERHALAVQELAEGFGLPVDQLKDLLAALKAQPRVTRELLLRRVVETWMARQRDDYERREHGG